MSQTPPTLIWIIRNNFRDKAMKLSEKIENNTENLYAKNSYIKSRLQKIKLKASHLGRNLLPSKNKKNMRTG